MLECFSIENPKDKKEIPGIDDLNRVQVSDLGSSSDLDDFLSSSDAPKPHISCSAII